jgi:hypothetical protein
MSVDIRSFDSVSPEDETASTVAKMITEQFGRVRLGLAFKKKKKKVTSDSKNPTEPSSDDEDTEFHTAIASQSSSEVQTIADPSLP